jgi:hypothetical protein
MPGVSNRNYRDDYVLQRKENHPQLDENVALLFSALEQSGFRASAYDTAKTVDKDHGRIER